MYPISGFAVGALAGLTGMGGGSIMTPLLILFFGVAPASAVGTDLLYAAITKGMGAQVHAYRRNVDWQVVGLLAAGSLPAAMLTLAAVKSLPPHSHTLEHAITTGLAIALVLSSAGLLFNGLSGAQAPQAPDRPAASATPALTIALGLLLGILVSLTSVGAGAVGVAILRHLYPRMPAVRLVGSDIAHAVPLTLLAGGGHWLIGDVQFALLGSLLLGSIPGICITSRFAHSIPDGVLRRVLGVVLLVVAVRMLMV